jgi:two-component system, LytTR family, sensor kinase
MEQANRDGRYGVWAAVIFGWWTVNGLASASQYYVLRSSTDMPITWAYALLTALVSAYMSVPVTLLALWLGWRHPFEQHRWPASLAIHLLAALGVVLFRAVLVVQLNPWIGWYGEVPPFHHVLLTSFTNNFFLYWMLVGVAHAVHYARASRLRERLAERLQTELVRTQLDALKAQLHPHFLFNALNTVVSLVHTDPDAAERTLTRLGDLLRRSLKQAMAEEIPLQEELEFVRSYVEIEQARFEERLQVEWRIAPDTLPACVPPLLLQPLVENAIRHGISPRSAPGRVEIRSERCNGSLRLLVRDDGVGLGVSGAGGGGVGLASTRKRLDQMYGGRHGFRLEAVPGGGAVAEITIPFRTADGSEPRMAVSSASGRGS